MNIDIFVTKTTKKVSVFWYRIKTRSGVKHRGEVCFGLSFQYGFTCLGRLTFG